MEIWKDIPGYESKYQVSNYGNVRSLNWRNTGVTRNLFLKPHNQGYLQVELAKDGKRKTYTVHKLVGMCFVPGFVEGYVINHINENRTDNRAENLEWCTQSQNTAYTLSRKNCVRNRKIKCSFPVLQLTLEGEPLKTWESPTAIKHSLGYSDWSIKQCCAGKRRQAYGYMWQYAA